VKERGLAWRGRPSVRIMTMPVSASSSPTRALGLERRRQQWGLPSWRVRGVI
jgi:hypothetical protein